MTVEFNLDLFDFCLNFGIDLQYKSRYEGDLVAKCYFAKHKLVWEVLDGGLKSKIEIQWSDIMAIKANYSDDGLEMLDVVVRGCFSIMNKIVSSRLFCFHLVKSFVIVS